MNIFDKVGDLIDTYRIRGDKMPLGELLKLQDDLATLSFNIAQESASLKKDYNLNYFMRKVRFSRKMVSLIREHNQSAARAEKEAMVDPEVEQSLRLEIEAEGNAYRCDILLEQINKILSAVSQRISYEKDEYRRTTMGRTQNG